MKCYYNIRLLITPEGDTALRGKAMSNVKTIENAAIVVNDLGHITFVGHESKLPGEFPTATERIDCHHLLLLPGFVDSHTHAVFAGERSNEFCMRAQCKRYQ